MYAGAEKLITSVEKMLDNHCLVFEVNDAKYSDCAECKSVVDGRYAQLVRCRPP
jgi:hypothetical protein